MFPALSVDYSEHTLKRDTKLFSKTSQLPIFASITRPNLQHFFRCQFSIPSALSFIRRLAPIGEHVHILPFAMQS